MSKHPAGKTTKEIILELAAQGMTAPEIARQTGIKYNTVYFHLNPDKCQRSRKRRKQRNGPRWSLDGTRTDMRVRHAGTARRR